MHGSISPKDGTPVTRRRLSKAAISSLAAPAGAHNSSLLLSSTVHNFEPSIIVVMVTHA